MASKKKFVNLVDDVFRKIDIETFIGDDADAREGLEYFNELKASNETKLTEKGAAVLKFMIENKDAINNNFSSAYVAAGLNISGRSVSGTFKSLYTNGFVTKTGANPVIYSITPLGEEQLN